MPANTRLRQVGVFFRHGSNMAMAIALTGTTLVLAVRYDPQVVWPFVLLGLFLFPLYEYAVHRWVLHARPMGSGWIYRLQRLIHYDHHQDPDRIDWLFTPVFLFLPLIALHALLYHLVSRSMPVTLALLTGSLLGYLHYEWVHYVAHLPGTPSTPWGRWLKKYHRWHHFKNERYWFGVTSPFIDMLMGTCRPVEAVEKSSTTRQLYEIPRRS